MLKFFFSGSGAWSIDQVEWRFIVSDRGIVVDLSSQAVHSLFGGVISATNSVYC